MLIYANYVNCDKLLLLVMMSYSAVSNNWGPMQLIDIESDKTTSIYNVSTRVLSKK